MHPKTNNERLLREYVRKILSEEMGDYYAGDMSGSPYGYRWGSDEDLYNTFVGPFVDVFKTTVAKTKEVTVKTRTLLWVTLQTILTTIIPFYGYNYTEVFEEEKGRIDKIRGEYKDVFERTDKALGSSDTIALAFMAAPAKALSALAISKAPEVFKDILSTATGGLSDELYDKAKSASIKMDRWVDNLGEGKINEDDERVSSKKPITPKTILTNKKFLSRSFESPKLNKMQQDATAIYKDTLRQIYSQAEELLKKAKSIEDLEKISKKKIPDLEKIKKLQGEERVNAENILLNGVRKSMKEFYIKNLTQQIETVLKAGIPEESQFVQDYRSTIQKIKAL
jgi:hypothetical protein